MIKAVMKVQMKVPVSVLWNVVTNNKEYDWRSDLSKIEELDAENFTEYTKNGFATQFHITEKIPFQKYSFEIKNANMKGHWVGIFKEVADETKFILEEQIEVSSFIMKLLAPLYLKGQQKKYIKNLEKKINEMKQKKY